MIAMIAALLAAVSPNAVILSYDRPFQVLSDRDGKRMQVVDVHTLPTIPPGGLRIVDANALGQPGITFNGATVYLRTSDVGTRDFAQDCKLASPVTKPGNTAVAATSVGAAAGLDTGSGQRCVQAGR